MFVTASSHYKIWACNKAVVLLKRNALLAISAINCT